MSSGSEPLTRVVVHGSTATEDSVKSVLQAAGISQRRAIHDAGYYPAFAFSGTEEEIKNISRKAKAVGLSVSGFPCPKCGEGKRARWGNSLHCLSYDRRTLDMDKKSILAPPDCPPR